MAVGLVLLAVGAGLPVPVLAFLVGLVLHFKHPRAVIVRRGARDTQGNFFRKARPFAGRGSIVAAVILFGGFAAFPVVRAAVRRVCPCGLLRLGGQARGFGLRGLGLNVDVLVQI